MTTEMFMSNSDLSAICENYRKNSKIDPSAFEKYGVKRGLRNPDGTGVMAGLTLICNVHGYIVADGELIPDEGKLTYRGIDIKDIINGCIAEKRFGFEEIIWLLLSGKLPNIDELNSLKEMIAESRDLPQYFAEDMIIKAPSKDIMNKLARSVLALYSYDDNPDDNSLENIMRQSIELISRLPTIMTYAYQVKRRHFDKQSMFFHPVNPSYSISESILHSLRPDCKFTDEEAKLLDLCLMLHAEHGGGNNSTFAARVLSSSGTDTYSAIAAAIGSLKGPRHGGANRQVVEMMKVIKEYVKDWNDEDEILNCLKKIINKEICDKSGLIYGLGHAIYTLSDPRAVILKENAKNLAITKNMNSEFNLYQLVERLAPQAFYEVKGSKKTISANVDFYSGFVYSMLDIPEELFTPLFAVARISGWCAHRIEEILTNGRIIRPAYRSIAHLSNYQNLSDRK